MSKKNISPECALQNAQFEIARNIAINLSGKRGYRYLASLEQLAQQVSSDYSYNSYDDVSPEHYFLGNYLKKCYFEGDDAKCTYAATKTFFEGEAQNRKTNNTIRSIRARMKANVPLTARQRVLAALLTEVNHKISQILGVGTPGYHKFIQSFRDDFVQALQTNGATVEQSSRDVRGKPWVKEASEIGASPSLLRRLAKDKIPHRFTKIRAIESSKAAFVHKNKETHRMIDKQDQGDLIGQKLIAGYIRKCLLAEGVNLNSQEIHRMLALKGSRYGTIATLDIQNGSGTMALELVREAIIREFCELLLDCRMDKTSIDVSKFDPAYAELHGLYEHLLEMFSAMGNCFTFELESLIFYAITWVCSRHKKCVSSFGDDIICHKDDVSRVIKGLRLCGFVVNKTKSFWKTDIRESCGMHAKGGRNITPTFMRKQWTDLYELYEFCNNIHPESPAWHLREQIMYIAQKHLEPCGIKLTYIPFNNESLSGGFMTDDTTLWKYKYSRRRARVMFKVRGVRSTVKYNGNQHFFGSRNSANGHPILTLQRKGRGDLTIKEETQRMLRYWLVQVTANYGPAAEQVAQRIISAKLASKKVNIANHLLGIELMLLRCQTAQRVQYVKESYTHKYIALVPCDPYDVRRQTLSEGEQSIVGKFSLFSTSTL